MQSTYRTPRRTGRVTLLDADGFAQWSLLSPGVQVSSSEPVAARFERPENRTTVASSNWANCEGSALAFG